jgi:diadenosine tetraphosphate (Ap4A) HIT family hydrolase
MHRAAQRFAESLPLSKFVLAPAFLATSAPLCELKLCAARLQADARWPWIVLIPRKAGAIEIEHLSLADRRQLIEETVAAGRAVRGIGAALGRPVDKLNVGQLGNVTAQLHVHVVGRRADDPAWPGPVWGVGEAQPYAAKAFSAAIEAAEAALAGFRAAP